MSYIRTVFTLCCFLLGNLHNSAQGSDISSSLGCSIFDFEKSPLQGWTSTNDAFKYQPILQGNNLSTNHHGNWIINSKRSMTSPCQAPGDHVDAKGTLTSPYFEIRTSNLTFLIGGGCNIEAVRVELLVNGLKVFMTTGDCKDAMTRKFWNTGPHVGKLAQIKIMDDSSAAPWGFISFDDLRTASACGDLQPCKSNQSMCLEKNDESKGVICRCSSSNVGPLPCGSSANCSINGGNCHSICTTSHCACQECSCSNGYQFNPSSLKCEDIDECATNYSGGCQYACVNTIGGYHCTCQNGYRLDTDKKRCVDIDECTVVKDGGCKNALCTNTLGSFGCVCLQGWRKNPSDPLTCVDIDECAANELCDPSQSCINTLGSYRCDCQPGYHALSNKCVDVNECKTENGGCDHTCTNTPSSFKCSCRKGYKLASNGKKCLDINECQSNKGGCQQLCHNIAGSYRCGCDPGYLLSNDNVTCTDIDECAGDVKCSHICTNKLGGYTCSCRHGYKLQYDNRTCLDKDECSLNKGGCSHNCQNTPGGYNCTCNSGYKLLNDEKTCIDINECLSNDKCEHQCTNTEGSFKCSCSSGYKLQSDGKRCEDINECMINQSCQHVCINLPGTYQCTCQSGHVLNSDNKTCSDINECTNNDTCQHTCTNLIGSYKCGCNHGYTLDKDKKSCVDVNECLQKDICQQKCMNTEGSYHCACLKGYNLAADNKSCVDIDECKDNSACQEVCTNSEGSYRCSCSDEKVLQSDGKTCKVPVPLNQALDSAKKDIQSADSSSALAKITKTLSDSLVDTKKITSNELEDTVQIMDQIKAKVKNDDINSTVEEAQTLLMNYIKVVNSVLDKTNMKSWKNVSDGSSKIASLPGKVEDMTEAIFKLVKNKNITDMSVHVSDANIDLQLNVTRRNKFKGFEYKSRSAGVKLDESLVKDSDNNDFVGVTVAVYKSISSFLCGKSNQQSALNPYDINSDIVSVKVINVDQKYLATLSEPVVIQFVHSKPVGDVVPSCSFINESGLSDDVWSSKGCWVNSTHGNVTVCMCNHTTSYGLLMDVHGVYDTLHDTHKEALKYISLIGCCISICFCVLTVIALTLTMRHPMEKKARYETFKLHINLVAAIGLSQVWFVIGSFLVDVDLVACRVVSIFTHYFLTASFCWMLVEGINVYNKIVKVFSVKKYGKFYFTLGWGFPLIMVIVTSAAVFNKYGPENICWLHKDVIWVFAVPVMVVIVANFFVLLSVVYVLVRKTMAFTATSSKSKENPKVKRTVKVTVVLLPLLGLTWIFGFLAIDKNFIVFHYLFAIINSLQGFFIFVAHCWINDSIRGALLEKLPSLPNSSKYQSSTKSGGAGGDGQRGSQIESNAFDNDTITASVPMPVHITMSTVQLLNLGKNSPEERRRSEAINDCMEKDNPLPGFAQ